MFVHVSGPLNTYWDKGTSHQGHGTQHIVPGLSRAIRDSWHICSIPHTLGVYTEYLCCTVHVQTILDMHTYCTRGEHVVINRRKPVKEDRVQYSYHT